MDNKDYRLAVLGKMLEMLADISPIVTTKCKLVDVTFLQSGDLVRKVMYCAMSEQVRDSYEKI